ncbi:RWP-RK domain containing protein [Quillaja saponaria]|uniref:RWP-RK domain containing protein n=1 Tax=Quillaja saponaria TaxID=32244 RepID=A0AAD7LXX7_QUISA|nr:RWP-RK domain containing protein [Quillaja saponaria]
MAFVPHHDPYDTPFNQNILNFANDQKPTITDLTQQGPFLYSPPLPPINETMPSDDDPFSDPMVHDAFNITNGGANNQAGPSNVHAENSHRGENNFGSEFW